MNQAFYNNPKDPRHGMLLGQVLKVISKDKIEIKRPTKRYNPDGTISYTTYYDPKYITITKSH